VELSPIIHVVFDGEKKRLWAQNVNSEQSYYLD
jgi:hypothetical protein